MQLKRLENHIQELMLWDKNKGSWIKFSLWPRQLSFLVKYLYVFIKLLVLKKRQVGMSQLVGADSLLQCLFQNNFTVLVLSITSDEARVFLDRIRGMYSKIPIMEEVDWDWFESQSSAMQENIIAKAANPAIKGIDAGEEIRFKLGSSIVSLSARKGRGRTADRVVVDESAHINTKNSQVTLKEVLQAIEPTLERANGQLVMITTANGMNLFHDYYEKAKYNISSFINFFFSCYDDPTFTEASRIQKIADHGSDHANQEYPRTDAEAFLASGYPRFDLEMLEKYRQDKTIKTIFEGDIIEHGNIWRMVRTTKPFVRQFKKRDPRGQYMLSIDVAEGLEKGDFSVIKVFDIESWDQMLEWHGHCEHMELGKIAVRIGRIYNNALIVPEANNHGTSTITQIRNEHYPLNRLFVSKFLKLRPDDDYKEPGKRFGWFTTKKTKKAIINNLAYMISNNLVPGLSAEDLRELNKYTIDSNGSTNAEEGAFDDRVITLGIAYYLLGLDSFYVHYPIRKYSRYEGCENCKHVRKKRGYEAKPIGKCDLSDRITHDEDICSLYANGRMKFRAD